MSSIGLNGQVAIVTGATKGIGRAICLALARSGAKVVGVARDSDPALALAEEIQNLGGSFAFHAADVAKAADCAQVVEATLKRHGRIDILVNNAGTSLPQTSADRMTEQDWRAVSGVTLEGTVFLCGAALPAMQTARRGTIINIASTAAVQTVAGMSAYAASKAGVVQYTKVVAVENMRFGIRANALLVGTTDTELVRRSLAAHRSAQDVGKTNTDAGGGGLDLLRDVLMMPAEGIADAVVLLCADEAREITASAIMLDRAYTAGVGHTHFIHWAATGRLPAVDPV